MNTPVEHPPNGQPTPARRSFWSRILERKFLFISIVLHVLFGLGATYYIVQKQAPPAAKQMTFKAASPTGDNANRRALEHKVTMAKKKAGGAPPQATRLSTAGLSKVSLPELPPISRNRAVVPNMPSGLAGLGQGLGLGVGTGTGAGMGGGGPGGPRAAMIFGKKIEATKLGVILDVSRSAHPHLPGAIAEIEKSFMNVTFILYPGCGLSDFEGKSGHDIRKLSSISKRDLEKKGNATAPHLAKALEIEDFEKMTKRPEIRDKLYVSWFDNEKGEGGDALSGRAQVAFEELIKRDVDSIYWFADFTDRIDAEVVKGLSAELASKKIKLHVHNFAGKRINSLISKMAEDSGGSVSVEKPQ